MKFFKSNYLFLLIFMFILSAMLVILYYFNSTALTKYLELQTREAEYRYEGMTLFPKETSDIIFTTLINTPQVIDIFEDAFLSDEAQREEMRERLYLHLNSYYKQLQKYNIQQLHFHLPDNRSFLRFHRRYKFGDDLTLIRPTIAYVNKNRLPMQGFEEGRIFSGYRFVYPLFNDKGRHLGSVEISHSVKTMTDMYERAFGHTNINIVLEKELVSQKVLQDEQSNYEPFLLNDDFLNEKLIEQTKNYTKVSKDKKLHLKIKERMREYEDFSISIKHQNHYDVMSFVHINNPVTKKPIAYVVSNHKSAWLKYFYKQYLEQIGFTIFVSFLITLAIFLSLRYYIDIRKKAHQDSLMKIYNRYFFENYANQKFQSLERGDTKLSLIMFDIDYFKNINDTYGHKAGDEALKFLGTLVSENIRKGDLFARWGGEEFMILVESNLQETLKLAENLRKVIELSTAKNREIEQFTCSFGVVELQSSVALESSYKIVDERLYLAKKSGRNRVVAS